MSSGGGNIAVSKTVFVSSSLLMGSGAIYLLYQMYTFSKQLKRLNCQITILTDKVYRAETEIYELRRHLETSSSDDAEDEFVDASDENQLAISLPNGAVSYKAKKEIVKETTADFDNIFDEIDVKIKGKKFDDLTNVLMRLNELKISHPLESGVYWRISETSYSLAEEEMLPVECPQERHKELMTQAKEAAEKSVKLNPQCGQAHRWAAIILGSLTQYMPTQDQIKSAYVIKEHIVTAIKYRPEDSLLYHMMGRWCYSVYMLSWVERKVASALFATPPTATLEEALSNFQKAENLNPLSYIPNQLYLGKCCIAKGDYKAAVEYLKIGDELLSKTADDRIAKDEMQKLYKQYKSYAT